MWIKKINGYYDKLSEYDNQSLLLHVSVGLLDMLKERVSFDLDDDSNMTITVIKYGSKEGYEVDEEGLLYWLQFTFHRELIDIILSLKETFTGVQNSNKKLINESKIIKDESKRGVVVESIEKNNKELETLKMILSKIDTYRRNMFAHLKTRDDIDNMITYFRIYKEQSA